MEQGWIKLHRQLADNLMLMHDNNAFVVFTKLLLIVNYKTGQYVTGRNKLAEFMALKPTTLYKVLIRLEDQGMITLTSTSKYTVITMNNWHKYQSNSTPVSNSTSNKQITDENIPLHIKSRSRTVTARGQHGNTKQELRKKNITTQKNKLTITARDVAKFPLYVQEFVTHRNAIKKPMTRYSFKLFLQKLEKLYPNNRSLQEQCVNEAIVGGWQTVYAIKQEAGVKHDSIMY